MKRTMLIMPNFSTDKFRSSGFYAPIPLKKEKYEKMYGTRDSLMLGFSYLKREQLLGMFCYNPKYFKKVFKCS